MGPHPHPGVIEGDNLPATINNGTAQGQGRRMHGLLLQGLVRQGVASHQLQPVEADAQAEDRRSKDEKDEPDAPTGRPPESGP